MPEHEKLNYLEFPASDLQATKNFFMAVFDWHFTDYGPDYSAFDNQGLEGGFYRSELSSNTASGAVLPIFYSEDLEATKAKVISSDGIISVDTFNFPGGRRFHFREPSGNELAVWTDRTERAPI